MSAIFDFSFFQTWGIIQSSLMVPTSDKESHSAKNCRSERISLRDTIETR